MRTLLRVSVPVEKGNEAIGNGTLGSALQALAEALQPEASYFFPDEHGRRSAMFVFDMQDSARIPSMVEPLFLSLGAAVQMTPVMNAEELERGLAELAEDRVA
jgi:hypothetical protein